jgi:hypothetical protein
MKDTCEQISHRTRPRFLPWCVEAKPQQQFVDKNLQIYSAKGNACHVSRTIPEAACEKLERRRT